MHRNEVVLAGRLSMEPAHRELPSGGLLTRWRLAVRRPGDRPGRQRSDAIECATFDDDVRDMMTGWRLDDLIEVEGALRRRWWRGGSRYEIEVRTARRIGTASSTRRSRGGGPCARVGTSDAEAEHAGAAAVRGAVAERGQAGSGIPGGDAGVPQAAAGRPGAQGEGDASGRRTRDAPARDARAGTGPRADDRAGPGGAMVTQRRRSA